LVYWCISALIVLIALILIALIQLLSLLQFLAGFKRRGVDAERVGAPGVGKLFGCCCAYE